MCQKFYATTQYEFSNGAIGWKNSSPMDCLGPFAKVKNCPIDKTEIRLTCYATGLADTCFSIPACTRYRGKYVSGFFTMGDEDNSVIFIPREKYKHMFENE